MNTWVELLIDMSSPFYNPWFKWGFLIFCLLSPLALMYDNWYKGAENEPVNIKEFVSVSCAYVFILGVLGFLVASMIYLLNRYTA